MAANKLVREPGKYFDCTSMHGKWCTITLVGQDVGYARVGIISSGKDYILFQFRDKKGLVAKAYVKHIVEIKMNERKLKKEQELVVRDWEDGVNPFTYFLISGAIFIYTRPGCLKPVRDSFGQKSCLSERISFVSGKTAKITI